MARISSNKPSSEQARLPIHTFWRRSGRYTTGILAVLLAYLAQRLTGAGLMMEHPLLGPLLWLLAITLAVVACWRRVPGTAWGSTGPPWRWGEALLLGAITLFALAVRVINNGGIPAMLTGDEGSSALAAIDLLEGRFNNIFITYWYSFPSLYLGIPATSIGLFGRSYAALRLPAAIAGTLTVGALYYLARPLFGRVAATVSAAFLAALNFHVHWSRIGLNNIWDGLFVVLVPAFFWRGWVSGQRWHFLAAGALLGLSQYFYTGARLIPLALAAWLLLALCTQRQQLIARLPDLGSMSLVALVVFMPLGLFFLGQPQEFAAPANRVSLLSKEWGDGVNNWFEVNAARTGKPIWLLLLENYRDAALGFVSLPLRHWYVSGKPLLLPLPALFFSGGVLLALLRLRDARFWYPLLMLAGTASIGAITDSTPASQRYITGAPMAALLLGMALAWLCRWVAQWWRWQGRTAFSYGLATLVLLTLLLNDLNFYFFAYAPQRGRGDPNTELVGELALYLQRYPADSQVYFFGAPRLVYGSFGTLPFLAPQVQATDVLEPLTALPTWELGNTLTAFVFVPERVAEAQLVKQRYPNAVEHWFYDHNAERMFFLYEVDR